MRRAEWLVEKTLWLLFVYISFVPYYYMQQQRLSSEIPAFSFVKYLPFVLSAIALGLWLFELIMGKRRFVSSPLYVYIVWLLGVSLLSLWDSEYAQVGLIKWVYYHITGCSLAFLVIQYGPIFARRLATFIASISGLWVLYTFAVALLGVDPVWGQIQDEFNPYHTTLRLCGPFGHTVATATYAMFWFPLAIWKVWGQRRLVARIIWGLVAALYIPIVLLTQTRGALLAIGVCVVLMLPMLKGIFAGLKRIDRRGWGLLATTAAVLIAVGGVGGGDMWIEKRLEQVGERWRQILQPNGVEIRDGDTVYHYDSLLEYTERFRIAQYYTVGNILEEHPLLGVGFGTFTLSFEDYKYTDNYMVREFPEHTTENMYLMWLAETGWVGLASRVLFLGAMVLCVFRAYRREGRLLQRHLLLAYLAAAGGLAFNLLTWDILNEPTLRMSFWLFSGVAIACSEGEEAFRESNSSLSENGA